MMMITMIIIIVIIIIIMWKKKEESGLAEGIKLLRSAIYWVRWRLDEGIESVHWVYDYKMVCSGYQNKD